MVIQEFPSERPPALRTETTPLTSLVHHRWTADYALPLEELEKEFRDRAVDYIALVRAGRVVGICSRAQLGTLLGSRFGFSLYASCPAHHVQVAHPLIVIEHTPVRGLLDAALARPPGEFREDVAVVGRDGGLVGLIPVERLARLQTELVAEQLASLESQHETLRRQNLDLFQANHALRQAQGVNRGLFDASPLGIVLLDQGGLIQATNRRLAELLDGEAATPVPVALGDWMAERDRSRWASFLGGRLAAGAGAEPATDEFTLLVPRRGPRLFRCCAGWIQATGQISVCLQDITEQRGLERNAQRQEKQRLLDTLVGGIAHELNNKLTPILGLAELLAHGSGNDLVRHASLISRSAQEASRIIRQLLQLSKPDQFQAFPVDLGTVVDESLLMLKFQLRERQCELRVSRSKGPLVVRADAAQIKQVLINLVLNALDAMAGRPQPTIEVRVAAGPEGLRLTVADNGTGIAPEHLGRIFDPFFTTKPPDRGTGLGLSICQSIVRQHGGDIAVESQLGVGTAFEVALPKLTDATVLPVVPDEVPARPVGATRRVLVVDDEEVVRLVVQEMLVSQFACHVDQARHGAEALESLAAGAYDLVISDIRMPVMNGTDLFRRARTDFPALAERFVFITGHPGEQSLQDEIAVWGVPVMAKPFTLPRLLEICGPRLAQAAGPALRAPAHERNLMRSSL
jgi:signal transduction histidine kinase